MKLTLNFINIANNPMCRIYINDLELYSGIVQSEYTFDTVVPVGPTTLTIEHWDKQPEDTVVENGIIVSDRSFELASILIDNYDLEELKWNSEFRSIDGAVYPSCLFFGPNGKFVLAFENPVLRWILKTRHEKNNNDPHWEEDYNYYTEACRLLTQILPK